jgi:tetratricopeptide (TPR) repeat protein
MEKLTLEDIKILHPGEQIKRAILNKYGSLEEFAKDINMELSSVNVYCHCKPYGTQRFGYKLTKALDKSYNEIVLDEKGQINRNINTVWDDESQRARKLDIEVLKSLKEMCIRYNFTDELSKVHRLFSIYYRNINRISVAIDYIKTAIELIEKRKNNDLLTTYYIDLIKLYSKNDESEKVVPLFSIVENLINSEDIAPKLKFKYFYRLGLFNINKDVQYAKELYKKALTHAKEKYEVGAALSCIGLACSRLGEYTKALEYYYSAINNYDSDDKIRICHAYNNLAITYHYLSDNIMAENSIDLAFKYCDSEDADTYFMLLCTLAKIKCTRDSVEIFNNMISFLSTSDKMLKNKENKINAINEILALLNKDKDIIRLIQLLDTVENLIDEYRNQHDYSNTEHEGRLIKCYGEISLIINKMQRGVDNEKEIDIHGLSSTDFSI